MNAIFIRTRDNKLINAAHISEIFVAQQKDRVDGVDTTYWVVVGVVSSPEGCTRHWLTRYESTPEGRAKAEDKIGLLYERLGHESVSFFDTPTTAA